MITMGGRELLIVKIVKIYLPIVKIRSRSLLVWSVSQALA